MSLHRITGEDTQTSESTDETNSWEEQEAQQPETIVPDEDDEVVPPSSDGMMEFLQIHRLTTLEVSMRHRVRFTTRLNILRTPSECTVYR